MTTAKPAYDAATDRRPGHTTRLRSDRRNGAWADCSCEWTSPIGLMSEVVTAVAAHLDAVDNHCQDCVYKAHACDTCTTPVPHGVLLCSACQRAQAGLTAYLDEAGEPRG